MRQVAGEFLSSKSSCGSSAGCCKAPFRIPPTPIGWEHLRVGSSLPLVQRTDTSCWVTESVGWLEGVKTRGGFREPEPSLEQVKSWCHFPRRAHAGGDAEIKRPVKLASLCKEAQACLCCEQVCSGTGLLGRAGSAGWLNGEFVPSWMRPVLFPGYGFRTHWQSAQGLAGTGRCPRLLPALLLDWQPLVPSPFSPCRFRAHHKHTWQQHKVILGLGGWGGVTRCRRRRTSHIWQGVWDTHTGLRKVSCAWPDPWKARESIQTLYVKNKPVLTRGLGCISPLTEWWDLLPLPSCSEEWHGESRFYRVLSLVDEPNLELVMINWGEVGCGERQHKQKFLK